MSLEIIIDVFKIPFGVIKKCISKSCYKCLAINLNHWKSILFMFENSDFMPYFDDFFRPGPCGSYVFYHSLPVVNPHTFYEHWLSKLYTKPFLSSSGDMLMKWRQQLWKMTLVGNT